jgi:TetR/AcrR family transcriptional regulator, mexJK operon transcriptional repressor
MTGQRLIRQTQKRDAIVGTARRLFLDQGYGGTSMSSIAAAIGGSKTTLWRYFPSRQSLFMAVIDDLVAEFVKALSELPTPDSDTRSTLLSCARLILRAVLTPDMVALRRLIYSEAGRFPEIGDIFYSRGLQKGLALIQSFLEQLMAKGRLRKVDSMQAAKHFIALSDAGCLQDVMMGLQANPTNEEIEQDVANAVSVFLLAYGRVSKIKGSL